MDGQLSWQLVLNFIAVYVLRFIETSDWRFFAKIQEDAIWVKRMIILIFSTVTAAGLAVHLSIETGNFVISGNLWVLVHAVKQIAQNYAGITGMYWGKYIFDVLRDQKILLAGVPKNGESERKTPVG